MEEEQAPNKLALTVIARHIPRNMVQVKIWIEPRRMESSQYSEGGTIDMKIKYWPSFKAMLEAGCREADLEIALSDLPATADEADLIYRQYEDFFKESLRRVLPNVGDIEVSGDDPELLMAFKSRVQGRLSSGDSHGQQVTLTVHHLRKSWWKNQLTLSINLDRLIDLQGPVDALLAALARAIDEGALERNRSLR